MSKSEFSSLKKNLVSIVIVTYNSAKEIIDCLDSIQESNAMIAEVIVIDNFSTDETPKILCDCNNKYKNIKVILNTENVGLAKANNQALGICQGEYILILNPDTLLKPDTINPMIEYMDSHLEVGVIGCQNVFEDGQRHTSFHRAWTVFHIIAWRVFPYKVTRFIYDRFSNYKEQEVMFVSGSCLMIKTSLFDSIGGYDEYFFLAVEDVADLCLRVWKHGYKVMFLPRTEVVHLGGRSHKSTPGAALLYGLKGDIYFTRKHKGLLQANLLKFILVAHLLIKTSIIFILTIIDTKNFDKSRKYYNIVVDVLKEK